MRIAFISYEYPPETGGGGIGTYLTHIIPALINAGHSIVLFAGTYRSHAYWQEKTVLRIPCKDQIEFNKEVVTYFSREHQSKSFDIIETTDFQGWGLEVIRTYPEIPYVVKLHTPRFLIDTLHYKPLSFKEKIRFSLGALKRFKLPRFPKSPRKENYSDECEIIEKATRIVTTTQSIATKLIDMGMLSREKKIDHVPYCIPLSKQLLKIQPKPATDTINIMFIGRMEERKGIINLALAIPKVLLKFPRVKFYYIGRSTMLSNKLNAVDFLKTILKQQLNSVVFTGEILPEEIPTYLDAGDIFVFPSHYESFGLVCTESMAAGKTVIGSKNGGMTEILDNGNFGLLTDTTPNDIAAKINYLIENPDKRIEFGLKAREHISGYYNAENIVEKQISSYNKAISIKND